MSFEDFHFEKGLLRSAAAAYQANMTRVVSFMMAAEVSNQPYPHIGVPDAFHPLSHHAENRADIDKLVTLQRWHSEMFAVFLAKLAEMPDGDGGSGVIQIPDLSRLGGRDGLAGFEPSRFHDLDALVGKLSYIFPLAKHLEFEVHTEWGGVYRDLIEDPTLDGLESSFGVALRPRLETMPLGSIGLDWSRETARLRFSFGGVE